MKIILFCAIFLACYSEIHAQTYKCLIKEIRFSKGASSVVLKGQLEPCRYLVYRFRAKAGQQMQAILTPESNDLVFLIQGTKFLPTNGSFVLPGIHKNGETEWNGLLPNDDVYEICCSVQP